MSSAAPMPDWLLRKQQELRARCSENRVAKSIDALCTDCGKPGACFQEIDNTGSRVAYRCVDCEQKRPECGLP